MKHVLLITAAVSALLFMSLPAWAQGAGIDDMDSDRSPNAPEISLDGEAVGPDDGPDWDVQSPGSDFYDDMGETASERAQDAAAVPPPAPEPKRAVKDEFGEPVKRW